MTVLQFNAPTKRPKAEMPADDARVIMEFALGDESKREAALDAHHRNIDTLGTRGNFHQKFMAEVEDATPDPIMQTLYRLEVVRPHYLRMPATWDPGAKAAG